ncbi:MAG: hypothetical protein ACRDPA_32090, partial [Solirubrobacteraceae bacterium]
LLLHPKHFSGEPAGVDVDTLLDGEYIHQSRDGSFTVGGVSPYISQVLVNANEAKALCCWLRVVLGQKLPALDPRTRRSSLAGPASTR